MILRNRLSRRSFLAASAAAIAMPRLSFAQARPVISHGVQSGDPSVGSGVVWTRADRPSKIRFDIATTDSFKNVIRQVTLDALPESDFAVKALIENLPAGQDIFFRATPFDLSFPTTTGEAVVGRFKSAPADKRSISFVWTGDTAGQGWGIDEARGGMRCYATMAKHRPDFFIHSGDTIYADNPIVAEVKLPDGTLWKNVVTEDKSKVAETLAEFRGNYKYNLLDRNVRAFNAEVPMLAQWDDHEVTNNWSPSKSLQEDKRYTEKNVALLAARAARAFHDYMPIAATPQEANRVYRKVSYGPLLDIFFLDMRTYRAGNGANAQKEEGPETVFLGREQIAWLKRELTQSRATWKVIAADMPLSIIVYDDGVKKVGSEAVAQGDGTVAGREFEFAELLSFIKHARIKNTVWLTADVHYTAANYYDPNKAQYQDFEPFWEFVSGPVHSGSFGPGGIDNTFGPDQRYYKGPKQGEAQNQPPTVGLQFFGHVAIDGASEVMTVTLRDVEDANLFQVKLEPKLG
ncbi:alkaline phosphatase D precursor [Variibacter gotjawalensis]|uniref:Alkaline phosphatase D n=1 Tax=Variibacter gotjawalensis TaxID=1333996 RepID=A0A0S3Q0T3_9BRAD|nr:alkaline phosphatase D family protein [Variibacter gotjawalensis]NIK47654.1 alkaline phosphatase D [Variibacter gotjawalensis]RZS49551.1 alkaline phosphatase D [Variibacter gotjawalensis]BAT61814.1 alkaline phosphatase D precursor [Variibacter gotjawalensis]